MHNHIMNETFFVFIDMIEKVLIGLYHVKFIKHGNNDINLKIKQFKFVGRTKISQKIYLFLNSHHNFMSSLLILCNYFTVTHFIGSLKPYYLHDLNNPFLLYFVR